MVPLFRKSNLPHNYGIIIVMGSYGIIIDNSSHGLFWVVLGVIIITPEGSCSYLIITIMVPHPNMCKEKCKHTSHLTRLLSAPLLKVYICFTCLMRKAQMSWQKVVQSKHPVAKCTQVEAIQVVATRPGLRMAAAQQRAGPALGRAMEA